MVQLWGRRCWEMCASTPVPYQYVPVLAATLQPWCWGSARTHRHYQKDEMRVRAGLLLFPQRCSVSVKFSQYGQATQDTQVKILA